MFKIQTPTFIPVSHLAEQILYLSFSCFTPFPNPLPLYMGNLVLTDCENRTIIPLLRS